jgi:hypothetical protein
LWIFFTVRKKTTCLIYFSIIISIPCFNAKKLEFQSKTIFNKTKK